MKCKEKSVLGRLLSSLISAIPTSFVAEANGIVVMATIFQLYHHHLRLSVCLRSCLHGSLKN